MYLVIKLRLIGIKIFTSIQIKKIYLFWILQIKRLFEVPYFLIGFLLRFAISPPTIVRLYSKLTYLGSIFKAFFAS